MLQCHREASVICASVHENPMSNNFCCECKCSVKNLDELPDLEVVGFTLDGGHQIMREEEQ